MGATGGARPVRSRAIGAWLAQDAARLDDRSVGEQHAGVFEDHHAVAEQAPALFWVAGDHARGLAVRRVRRRAPRWGLARPPRAPPPAGPPILAGRATAP